MPWLKLYTEIVDDPKLSGLSPQDFQVWIYLLCLAGESSVPGVIGMDLQGVAWRTRLQKEVIEKAVDRLVGIGVLSRTVTNEDRDMSQKDSVTCHILERGLVTLEIVNWGKRQSKKPTDDKAATRERKRRSRASRHVTPGHAGRSRDVTRLEGEEEVEEEEEKKRGEEEETRPRDIGRSTGIGLVAEAWSSLGYAKDLPNSGEPFTFATAQLVAGVPVEHLVAALRATKWFLDEKLGKGLIFVWRALVDETPIGGTFRYAATDWPGESGAEGEAPPRTGRYELPEDSAYTLARPKRRVGALS